MSARVWWLAAALACGGSESPVERPVTNATQPAALESWREAVVAIEMRMDELRLGAKGSRTDEDLRRTASALERLVADLEVLYADIDASWDRATVAQQAEMEGLHARLSKVRVDVRGAQLAIEQTLSRRGP